MSANGRAAQTAMVEVLTAEVRVLQVGARQVTLSVFRQLDQVPADEIEPFGRVQDKHEADKIEVVGSHCGQLARAAALRSENYCYGSARGQPEWSYVPRCQAIHQMDLAWSRCGWKLGGPQGLTPSNSTPAPPWAQQQQQQPVPPPEVVQLDQAIKAHRHHEWFTYAPSQELWERFEALPLIVLAGLR